MSQSQLAIFVSTGMDVIKAKYMPTGDYVDLVNPHALRKWNAAYGQRPIVLFEAWLPIKARALKREIELKHFFWALNFMKTYQTEDNLARTLNTTPKTLRGKVKGIIKLMAPMIWTKVGYDCLHQGFNYDVHLSFNLVLMIFRFTISSGQMV